MVSPTTRVAKADNYKGIQFRWKDPQQSRQIMQAYQYV